MSKKICFIVSLLAVLAMANNVTAELVAYYSLDEGAGEVVADGSGNGYDGTIEGDPTWVDGAPGFNGALQFGTAGSDRVNCGMWDNTLGTGEMTVSCWVNFSPGGTTLRTGF